MKNAFVYSYLLSLAVLMVACGSKPSHDVCGEVEFIGSFPHEYTLTEQRSHLSDF